MSCSVIRNRNDNKIKKVLAPNGSESLLYSHILSFPELKNNEEEALKMWAQVHTPSFKKFFKDSVAVDKNNEPIILYKDSEVSDLYFKDDMSIDREKQSLSNSYFLSINN